MSFQNFVYNGKGGEKLPFFDEKGEDRHFRAILIEAGKPFFDLKEDKIHSVVTQELRKELMYQNLNANQSILFFEDRNADYILVANHIYVSLKRLYAPRFHLAVSRRFDSVDEIPQILKELEMQMAEKYYHTEAHVFPSDDESGEGIVTEVQDSRLVEMISTDISRKNMKNLWRHYEVLSDKFGSGARFSAMYVKFVFFNVIQELYSEKHLIRDRNMEKEVDLLYRCNNLESIRKVVSDSIQAYEDAWQKAYAEAEPVIDEIIQYMERYLKEDLRVKKMAEMVHIFPGHLSRFFTMRTGKSIYRYLHVLRMEHARELMGKGGLGEEEICRESGFTNLQYFRRSFRDYFDREPA